MSLVGFVIAVGCVIMAYLATVKFCVSRCSNQWADEVTEIDLDNVCIVISVLTANVY